MRSWLLRPLFLSAAGAALLMAWPALPAAHATSGMGEAPAPPPPVRAPHAAPAEPPRVQPAPPFEEAPMPAPPRAPGAGSRRESGALVMQGIPDLPAALAERLRPYQNARQAVFYDWTADGGGILIGTRFGDTVQVHLVERPGGDRRQITFLGEPVPLARACPAPGSRTFLYTVDSGGAEQYQIALQDLDGGGATIVTDGASRNVGPVWSNRGDRFAYASTRRNGRDLDLYVAERVHPKEARPVLRKEGAWSVLDWSPDDASLLVERDVSVHESYLYVLDLATGGLAPLQAESARFAHGAARFDRRGHGVYLTSDEGSEVLRLRYRDLDRGTETVLPPDVAWDVEGLDVAPRGDRVAFVVNDNGYSRLYLLDGARRDRPVAAKVPEGVIGGLRFDPAGTRLALSLQTATAPPDVHVLDLKSGTEAAWTESEVGGLDRRAFVAPELVTFPTFDGPEVHRRAIPAFYYRPKGNGAHPVLIVIHGGPEGQWRPDFAANVQYWVNELGLAVLAPNVRGSTGYGRSYVLLDDADKREDAVRDIGALLDWIASRPELDRNRVAVYGGSYGGYMVLASVTHYSERLRAAVDIVGISNFVSFLERTSGYRQDLRRVEYGDERDPKMRAYLESIAPLNHVERVRTPLFIVQGQNDPRVPMAESEQMLAAVQANGTPAWYLLARDEGHGFRKKANTDVLGQAVSLFLETYLLGSGPAPAAPVSQILPAPAAR